MLSSLQHTPPSSEAHDAVALDAVPTKAMRRRMGMYPYAKSDCASHIADAQLVCFTAFHVTPESVDRITAFDGAP